MNATIWLVALLSLALPAEYGLTGNSSERIALVGPPGTYATQEFRSWKAPDGRALHLFFWIPRAPRDLGPMKASAEWPVSVAGQNTKVIETSLFMGRGQRVLVTYLHFADPEAHAMFYASGVERSDFDAILSGITVTVPKH